MLKTFKDYLKEVDLSVSFDPDKEELSDVVKKAQQTYRTANADPQRAAKQTQADVQQQAQEIKGSDDPLANEKLAIKNMEMRLAKMKQNLAAKEAAIEKQAGNTAAPAPTPGV